MRTRDRLRRTAGVSAEIGTSSTGDIAFLLIVFFMVTAVFASTRGLQLDLPREDATLGPDRTDSVLIEITPGGILIVDCGPLPAERLLDYLKPRLARNPAKPVVVYPRRGVVYSQLVAVYDVLLQAPARQMPPPVVQITTPGIIDDYVALFDIDPFAAHCGG